MKKAVVYWSGTGNTEAMAKAVAEAAGAELFTAQWAQRRLRNRNSSLCSMA